MFITSPFCELIPGQRSMECPLWRLLISSRLVSKHGYCRNLVGIIYEMSSNLWRLLISSQVSVYMAKQFQRRRFFRNRPIRNKNYMWWPCLLTDRDEMSNLHRGHSIEASYKVLVVAKFGRYSLKSAHFVMIHYQTWPPQAILISDWPI
jgi:hypothetical protein